MSEDFSPPARLIHFRLRAKRSRPRQPSGDLGRGKMVEEEEGKTKKRCPDLSLYACSSLFLKIRAH